MKRSLQQRDTTVSLTQCHQPCSNRGTVYVLVLECECIAHPGNLPLLYSTKKLYAILPTRRGHLQIIIIQSSAIDASIKICDGAALLYRAHFDLLDDPLDSALRLLKRCSFATQDFSPAFTSAPDSDFLFSEMMGRAAR